MALLSETIYNNNKGGIAIKKMVLKNVSVITKWCLVCLLSLLLIESNVINKLQDLSRQEQHFLISCQLIITC